MVGWRVAVCMCVLVCVYREGLGTWKKRKQTRADTPFNFCICTYGSSFK